MGRPSQEVEPSTAEVPSLAVLWRTKLRSGLPGIDHESQVNHCLGRSIVGIGWGDESLADGEPIERVLAFIQASPRDAWGTGAAHTVRRFALEAKTGDFVWTRDTHGRYLLCRITGAYRYENSAQAKEVDVHQVRPVESAPRPLDNLEVPGAVVRAFTGTGLSFSRIHDPGARRLTPYLWDRLHGRAVSHVPVSAHDVLRSHLDPYDVEDLIFVWFQAMRRYVVLPRSRRSDTPTSEWTMIHRDTGRRAIVQIKSGGTAVDLVELASGVVDQETDTFAFSTSETYIGDRSTVTEIIGSDELVHFAREHRTLLPLRVQTWFDLARD